jgi:hypothetical protein
MLRADDETPPRIIDRWILRAAVSAGLVALAEALVEWGVDELKTMRGKQEKKE